MFRYSMNKYGGSDLDDAYPSNQMQYNCFSPKIRYVGLMWSLFSSGGHTRPRLEVYNKKSSKKTGEAKSDVLKLGFRGLGIRV